MSDRLEQKRRMPMPMLVGVSLGVGGLVGSALMLIAMRGSALLIELQTAAAALFCL
ncbi:MAG: hypothetical protein AAFV26_11145 [Pseudomonadota bacterium]